MPYPGYPVAMSLPDAHPFEVIDFGNGQVFVSLPGGVDDIPKVIAFAKRSPALFAKFFPGVDIDEVIAGNYQWFDEPAVQEAELGTTATSSTSAALAPVPVGNGTGVTASAPAPAPIPTPVVSVSVASAVVDPAVAAPVVSVGVAAPATASVPSMTVVPTPSVPLSMRQAIVAGICFMDTSYRGDYNTRLQRDRDTLFVFSPLRRIPADAHKLTGAAYRAFLASQGLPPYVSPTRVKADFVPRKQPKKTAYQATKVTVRGGDFLWNLARDPTPLDLIFSTTGTTVLPMRGRTYTFAELFPEETESHSLTERAGPSKSWGSSPTMGSPWPSSSQDSALDSDMTM
ncbi:uncharacterized protein SCHCODRAFT_01104063 [Schizophyllum commune H4-8]|uniref:Uncharacterized protein n=1 Tax=Schizophyllum commune (strain H4-8 / FGSC 9210) TaxID=578458 RepID=D8QFU8_SCHCM|nr:uncharacterized protein SCHCODRAFT_01104063 [Schizophyllum commune H4-8]KAI5887794.1 hypothetical protein SCHCODRAFT_01104063 [Schizophyllum commune H4-8]